MNMPIVMAIAEWLRHMKSAPIIAEHTKLELFLFVFAILTISFLLISAFTSLGEQRRPPYITEPLSYDDMPTFERTLAFAVNSTVDAGTSIETLTNGAEFLPDVLLEIDNATSYIYMTNYLWDDGTFGTTLFEHLIKKAKQGVRVRVLLDGLGSRTADDALIKQLNDAGGQVAFFRPIRWWDINRWNRRNHMRDVVIDGDVGYLGGIAFTDPWLGNATSSDSWHDYMFKVRDGFAHRLEGVFTNLWSQTTGEILPVSHIESGAYDEKNVHFVSLFSSPAPDTSSDMEHFIWLSIIAAQKSIYIENPYILPSKSIQDALMSKARAGVDVKIIGPDDTDAKHVKWASESYYTDLLDAGIRLYEYKASRIHAKTMIIDGTWSIIGSANLDNRSSRINLELIGGTDDPHLAQTLAQKFNEDLSKSEEVTKESWGFHSKLFTPIRLLSRLFIRQY